METAVGSDNLGKCMIGAAKHGRWVPLGKTER